MVSSKRTDLVETAVRLFAQHGYHATGIDLIAEEANVSKRTLYQHFRTKDELILAALRHYDGVFRNQFIKSIEARATDPADRILAVFDFAEDWFSRKSFCGCMFINAVGEYSTPDTAIRAACKEFKRLMRNYVYELAVDANAMDPETFADEIALLLEGAIVTAQVSDDMGAAARAKRIAGVLLRKAGIGKRPSKPKAEAN
ncbi:MAG: TetR/AcrR family transcriptional regulator [Myxococcales bacterium]|nr:TetR/AcrR family transcriptional regulator [Myxococcales bacterium]